MKRGEEEEERKTTAQRLEEEEEEEERKTTAQRLEEEEQEEEEEEEEEEEQKEEGEEEEDEAAAGGTDDEDEGDERTTHDQEEDDDDDDEDENKADTKTTAGRDRKCVPGIIYLGHIPPRLRPKHMRNLLSAYGEIGRIFLQPEDNTVKRKRRKAGSRRCDFTEGWVEFRDKRVAKRVAASLHNTPMGTRKRQHFSSDLWSIKYLHRFLWTHLSERLAYEQTVLQQRLRTEVSQAKRETNFYLNSVEKSARLDKLRRKRQRAGEQVEEKTWDFTQRQTEEEIQTKKRRTQKQRDKARLLQQDSQSNVSLLAKIFNSKQSE